MFLQIAKFHKLQNDKLRKSFSYNTQKLDNMRRINGPIMKKSYKIDINLKIIIKVKIFTIFEYCNIYWKLKNRKYIQNEWKGSDLSSLCTVENANREPETQQKSRPFGPRSMAERQRFGCQDTWPCNCKKTPSLRSPIERKPHDRLCDGRNISVEMFRASCNLTRC